MSVVTRVLHWPFEQYFVDLAELKINKTLKSPWLYKFVVKLVIISKPQNIW